MAFVVYFTRGIYFFDAQEDPSSNMLDELMTSANLHFYSNASSSIAGRLYQPERCTQV